MNRHLEVIKNSIVVAVVDYTEPDTWIDLDQAAVDLLALGRLATHPDIHAGVAELEVLKGKVTCPLHSDLL